MSELAKIGWTGAIAAQAMEYEDQDWEPGRVIRIDRRRLIVATDTDMILAVAAGRLVSGAESPEAAPAVGDWVMLRREHDLAMVEAILPRRSLLIRKKTGRESVAQGIAANVDDVFVVTAVGSDFSVRRIERLVSAILDGGSSPVVVVNKIDLPHQREDMERELRHLSTTTPVYFVSTVNEESLAPLDELLVPGRTIALVGSSGVGKSTMINRWVGEWVEDTCEVREKDGKGRHTTTARHLHITDSGALLIDTPGIRGFGIWDAEEGIDQTFEDIAALAEYCKFTDCRHENEPDCAVLEAMEAGDLAEDRLESYRALVKESEYHRSLENKRLRKDSKSRWKQINKEWRTRQKLDEKWGKR